MNQIKSIVVGVGVFILVYFGYLGLTTKPWEGDSLGYHIPIVNLIKNGKIWQQEYYTSSLFYYPAGGETMLAAMDILGVPLNIFNLLGTVVLFLMVLKMTKSWIIGLSVVTVTTVVRLLTTQTMDIWLAVWWIWSVYFLKKNKWLLGVGLGMLAGTKYSGLLYLLPLILLNFKQIINIKTVLVAILIGGSWYIRNWLWTGNLFYPAGDAGFLVDDWAVWKTMLTWDGIKLWTISFWSEYLVWGILIIGVIIKGGYWGRMTGLNFLMYLLMPSWPVNTMSDLRYAIPVLLAAALGVQKTKIVEIFLVWNSIMVMTILDFRPKIFLVSVVVFWLISSRYLGNSLRLRGEKV